MRYSNIVTPARCWKYWEIQMKVSRTVRLSIAALLAASASLCAWAGGTGNTSDPLGSIQRTLNAIDLKLSVDEQSQVDIKLKLEALTAELGDEETDLQALHDSTLQLLDTSDAVGVEIDNLDAKLAEIIDTLKKMASDTTNSSAARLAAINNALVRARTLAKRADIDSAQADALHTAIKVLALKIEEKIG